MKLDPDQQKAVEHFEGPALVVAGPGSGKTTVIKNRILHLIHNYNVDPEHILAIAFTNAAVEEMKERIRKVLNHKQPEICTLHVFGKDLITTHYKLVEFSKEPDIWDETKIEQIINEEKYRLQRASDTASVAIYKFEGMMTARCYIGQTTDPERRESEHRTHSSNRWLREALQKGDEKFEFKVIATVNGQNADGKETDYINFYRNRAVVDLGGDMELVEGENPDLPVTIYKIKSRTKVTCYIGHSINPERSKKLHFKHSPNAALRKAIEEEGIEQFTYEIIEENVPWARAPARVESEIVIDRNRAVFNRQNPLQARDSNRRRIEVFCQYFNVAYDKVIEHTQKFKDLMGKFDKFKDDIVKEKRQVDIGRFDPDEIADPVFRAFAKRYESIKQEADAIDFLDMLILSAYMLEKYPELLLEYQEKYRYVFVDEFQDISPVDFRLINLFSGNLFAVGDDDQAIYGFRGGDSQIMQEKFGKQENVTHYEITRNYRSTLSVVKHSKSLIVCNNPHRFSKNLRAENPAQSRADILNTSPDTIENALLSELLPIVTICETHFKENTPYFDNLLLQELTTPQEIGILARNWYEVKKIRQILRRSKLLTLGFKVDWSEADDADKRKMFLRRGTKEIEVSTIHSAKGREWEKVILIVNTVKNRTGKLYVSLPDSRNNLTEERRVFYVAITRSKHELVILGEHCQFISEFRNVRPIEIVETIESQIKKELQEVSQKTLQTLKSKLKQELEDEITTALKQSDKLNRLRSNVAEAEKASKQMQIDLPQQVKSTNDALIEGLIPVLDEFESNDIPVDLVPLTEDFRRAHVQLLDSLKNHGLKPIEAVSNIFNPTYHEKVSSDIYSSEVPTGRIAKEEQRGYLLHDQVFRKSQVVISKRKQQADVFLSQDFAQPVRFVTYTGFRDLKNIETFKDGVKGLDSQDKEVQLQSLNVLFAFPKEDMKALRPCIKKWLVIANRNLQPIALTSERSHVTDDILKRLLIEKNTIELDIQNPTLQLTTRSGYVLDGHLWDFDEDFLYMNINNKDVVVYRSGILKLVNLIWNEITEVYKNGTSINGHVTEQIRGGLRVKFKSLIGFLPASQVELKTVRNLDSYVGKTLKMKVTKFSKSNNNILFSRRALLGEERTKLFNTFREIPEEPITLRNMKRMSKKGQLIPGTNGSPPFSKAKRIRLDKSISVIVTQPIEEVIGTPPPISTDFMESLNAYIKDCKPATPKIVEVRRDPLYEPIDLVIPEPVKGVVDSRLPIPKGFLETPNSHTQNLTPETPRIEIDPKTVNSDAHPSLQQYEAILKKQIQEIKPEILEPDIVSYPPIAVTHNTQETPQGHEAILKKQIQEIKPETSEPENPDNVTQEPTLETCIDRETPGKSTTLTRSDSSTEIDNDASQVKGQISEENKVEDIKKSLEYYLRRGGRFAVEKIKSTFSKKPNS